VAAAFEDDGDPPPVLVFASEEPPHAATTKAAMTVVRTASTRARQCSDRLVIQFLSGQLKPCFSMGFAQ
jgi:hypothetical protein